MTRTAVEKTLVVETTVDTLDEALTFAVQELDTHHFKPAGYRIEIVSAIEQNEDEEDVYCFSVLVQGTLGVDRLDVRLPRLEPDDD